MTDALLKLAEAITARLPAIRKVADLEREVWLLDQIHPLYYTASDIRHWRDARWAVKDHAAKMIEERQTELDKLSQLYAGEERQNHLDALASRRSTLILEISALGKI